MFSNPTKTICTVCYIERNSINRDILRKKIFKHIYKYQDHRSHSLRHLPFSEVKVLMSHNLIQKVRLLFFLFTLSCPHLDASLCFFFFAEMSLLTPTFFFKYAGTDRVGYRNTSKFNRNNKLQYKNREICSSPTEEC